MIGQYQFQNNLLFLNTKQKEETAETLNVCPPFISVMFDLKPFLLCGSIKGDLHFVKQSCLYFEKDFISNEIPKEKMCLAKTYAAHVSFVN
jgi:hypothetical protein